MTCLLKHYNRQPLISYAVYRPGEPQNSSHYQCMQAHFETFEQVYEERLERRYGFFRPHVYHVIYRYLNCGYLQQFCAGGCLVRILI
jgi:hypothetical protein